MANPRKFSEKIALMNQREAEQNAAYQQVMASVTPITRATNEEIAETQQQPVYRERGRSPGVGPMRRERRIDTSPYNNSSSFLLPPDSSWKHRSDSALHQSSISAQNSPGSPRRSLSPMGGVINDRSSLAVNNDVRINRSSSDVSRVTPRISIDPTQTDPNAVSIPIPNTTGSLPDLHNFQYYQPPGMTPIDPEDPISPSCSTVYTTEVNGSMIDPSSMHQQQQSMLYQQQQQQQQQTLQRQMSPQPPHSPQQAQQPKQEPSSPLVNSNHNMPSSDHHSSCGMLVCRSQSNKCYLQPTSLSVYRDPLRPSPQPSPVPMSGPYLMPGSPDYRSSSPADTASHSAPQSPISQNISPVSSPGIGGMMPEHNNYNLHQEFSQISMDWCQLVNSLVESEWTAELQQDTMFANSPPNSAYVPSQFQVGREMYARQRTVDYNCGWHPQALVHACNTDDCRTGSQDMGSSDMGYCSRTSPNYSNMNSNSGGSTQQTTPQTPTPNITISVFPADFSDEGSVEPELSRDLTAAMITASFDTEALTDEILSTIEPIPFDDLPLLNNNIAIADALTEDTLRLNNM
ncbi:CREB-regulated transcription coactivator 1 isoform X12 [Cloeon dipterum]|uniref:CREB-regulated transcription coactivator 1 isoform X12 n=1 Tax=Cloeon dipterum TaxID=197152 RepID=UPI0032204588